LGLKTTYQIDAPHFCCGIIIEDGTRVVEAANIISWAYKKPAYEVFEYFIKKGYRITKI